MNLSWFEENFFKYTIGIILLLLIILLLYYTAPFFAPILWFVTAVFLPVLFSAFLYYILRPVVNFLGRWLPRYVAILVVYILVGIVIPLIFLILLPGSFEEIYNISPEKLEILKTNINKLVEDFNSFVRTSNIPIPQSVLIDYIPKINLFIKDLSINLISTLASLAISIALTPFVLYYFLRDDGLLSRFVLRFVPAQFQDEAQKILDDIDSTLSEFILAQMTIAGIIGLFLLIGYYSIGLPHPLALALFAMVFYIIPFLGTFIAIIPAVIVALTISFGMTAKVVLVMFIAHFLEANVITPRLMSYRLKIHPLTIILLLLAAGSLGGILGLLLITPTYALLKVIIWNIYKISRLHYAIAKSKAEAETEAEANNLPA